MIRVSNPKLFRVSIEDIVEAGRRDEIPTLLTDGVPVSVHALSARGLEISFTAEDATKLVTDFKAALGLAQWELFLPKHRLKPIVDPATGQREIFARVELPSFCVITFISSSGVMIGPLPAETVLALLAAGLRSQGIDLVFQDKRKRAGIHGIVTSYANLICLLDFRLDRAVCSGSVLRCCMQLQN